MLSALRTFLLRWTGMTEMTVMEDPAPLAAPGAGRSMSSGGLGSAAPPGCSLATDPDGADLQAAVPPGTGENFITSAARRGKRAAPAPSQPPPQQQQPKRPRTVPGGVARNGAQLVAAAAGPGGQQASDSADHSGTELRQATPDRQQQLPCLPSKDSPHSPQAGPSGQRQGRQPSPQRQHSPGHLHHHHHDAVEETVFSPTFHRAHEHSPSRSAEEPAAVQQQQHHRASSHAAAAGRSSQPQVAPRSPQPDAQHLAHQAGDARQQERQPSGGPAGGSNSPLALGRLQTGVVVLGGPLRPPAAHGGPHAIDLNVVECVDADDGDSTPRISPQPAHTISAAAAAAAGHGHGLVDYEDDDEDVHGHDENAAHHQHGSGGQQQQQQPDQVLVASAPRPGRPDEGADSGGQQGEAEVHVDEAEDDEEEEEEEYLEFDPLLFIKQLPPLEQCIKPHRPALLPRRTRACRDGKTLVLDLDETLVHSSLESVERADFSFPVTFNGAEHMVHVRQRPHLHEFMERVAGLFEVVVFTASQKIYAEKLLNILDPQHVLVKHRIYRDSCVIVDGNYLKDLTALGRDMAHTVIVDNSPQAFGFQVDNGIPIESWYDDDTDCELLRLLPFLESLVDADDVRPRIRRQFRLQELIDQAGTHGMAAAIPPGPAGAE